MFESDLLTAPALRRLSAAVDELLELDFGAVTEDELLQVLRDLERVRRRSVVVDHHLVAELTERGTAGRLGCRDTATLLAATLRLSPGDARARARAARDLGPRHAITGQALPPLFCEVSAAQEAGSISAAHARVIVDTITALPAALEREQGAAVQARLVVHAEHLDPARLAVAARRITDLLDPDGILADDADHARRRELNLRAYRDGSGDVTGRLTPECLVAWQTVLDALAAPRPSDADGADQRTAGQRRHDALLDAGRRLLMAGEMPSGSGVPATVVVTMTLDQLEARTGVATNVHGGLISVAAALRIAAEAQVIPVVLGDDAGGVLAYGRARRIASTGQRIALIARDGGCSFPGCDSPGTWDQVHHVVPWADGGCTDLDNLTLLCSYHHREFGRRGWSVAMHSGLPEWTPPAWIDAQRRAIRNALWTAGDDP